MGKHLLFYDGECGLCDHIVEWVLLKDQQKDFLFAPLQGVTMKRFLEKVPEEYQSVETLVFIENIDSSKEKIFFLGKGALKVFWWLGGSWKILGVLSFLPWPLSFVFDLLYRMVARYRHRFLFKKCRLPKKEGKERFLP